MKENLRGILIFVITVGTGTVLIMLNLPLVLLLPVTAAIGCALLILFGAIPVTVIKKPFVKTKKVSLIIKPEDEKGPKKSPEPGPGPDKIKPVPQPVLEKKRGVTYHLDSIISSFRTLRTILSTPRKTSPAKVGEIDKLLDGTISEKVKTSAIASAGAGAEETGFSVISGAGGVTGGTELQSAQAAPEDPFLSLSSDELETGLLNGIEEEEIDRDASTGVEPDISPSVQPPSGGSGFAFGESDIPLPPQQISSEVPEISIANEPDPDDFGDFEDMDFIDENLGELDAIDFGSVNLDEDTEEEESDIPAKSPAPGSAAKDTSIPRTSAAPAESAGSPSLLPDSGRDQTAVDQPDMVVFTADTGADDNMVSSLAADIRTVKKSQDLMLLRELKDFKAPGKDIEAELSELYKTLDIAADKQKKQKRPPPVVTGV